MRLSPPCAAARNAVRRRSLPIITHEACSMQSAARERLAKAQADLVRALVAQGPIPAGFDEKMLRVAARSLVNKRRQQTARSWPNLAKIFGAKYPELFTQYAQSHSLP